MTALESKVPNVLNFETGEIYERAQIFDAFIGIGLICSVDPEKVASLTISGFGDRGSIAGAGYKIKIGLHPEKTEVPE